MSNNDKDKIIKDNLKFEISMLVIVTVVGFFITISSILNAIIIQPENLINNDIGVIFGFTMQILGLTLIINRIIDN